jgi:hypothetical protein
VSRKQHEAARKKHIALQKADPEDLIPVYSQADVLQLLADQDAAEPERVIIRIHPTCHAPPGVSR